MIPEVSSWASAVPTIPYMSLVIILTARSKKHLRLCSISFQSHLAVLWPCSQEKGGSGVASTALCLCSGSPPGAAYSTFPFLPTKVVKCVCVCVCVCRSTTTGLQRACQLGDGFQTIPCVSSGWTNKHFGEAI